MECTACELHKTKGKCYVQGIGNLKADVFIIGEYPFQRDAATGIPFSGRDKDVLANLLSRLGLKRNQVFTSNLLQCAPPTDDRGAAQKPTPAQFEACWQHLERELDAVRPKVVLLLGAGPASFLLGSKTLGAVAGRVMDSKDFHGIGYALSGETKSVTRGKAKTEIKLNKAGQFKVVCTYSPAAALRDPSRLKEIERAFDTVGELLSGKVQEKKNYDYSYAYTEAEVNGLLTKVLDRAQVMHTMEPNGAMAFDIETSGFNWYRYMFGSGHISKTLSIAFCFEQYKAYGVSLRDKARSPRNLALLKAILEHPVKKCGHNGKFDNVFLRGELGIRVVNFNHDTMIAAYHLDQEAELGLAKLSPVFRPDLGYYWEEIEKLWLNRKADGKGKDSEIGYLYAPDDMLLTYNCRDVDVTQSLYQDQCVRLREWGAIEAFTNISMPHSHALEDMEFNGIGIDVDRCIEMGKKTAVEVRRVEAEALALVGRHPHWWGPKEKLAHNITAEQYKPLNIASGKQLGELLFVELKLPSFVKTDKGAPSVNEEALTLIKENHAVIPKLLEYRKIQKQLSTYLGWEINEDGTEGPKTTGSSLLALVGADGRIRPNLHITGTGTGRLSSSSPNLQNQPKEKEFQDLFWAGKGRKFVDNDFSALELRVAALLANDESLMEVFRSGVDPHSATASKMFNIPLDKVEKDGKERKAAKAINFGILYGKGAPSLADDLGVTKQEAERWLVDWGRAYPGIMKFIAQRHQEVKKFGYVSYSMGRRRPLPGGLSTDEFIRSEAERASVNTPVQGTGADCTSIAVIRIRKRFAEELDADARLVLEIHDAIIADVLEEQAEKAQAIMLEEMRRQMPMLSAALPLDATSAIKDRLGDK